MNNPLSQYFRRPGIYLKLPSLGKFYPPESIDMPENKELPIYPMTAIDEITSKTPDALYNGTAVVDIIKSCVPAIKDPWAVPACDLDSILIAIRAASNGSSMDLTLTCPKCEEENTYGVNLTQLLSTIVPGDYDTVHQLGELKFKFKPISYREVNQGSLAQFTISREITQLDKIEDEDERSKKQSAMMKKLTGMNMEILAMGIEGVVLPSGETVTNPAHILEYLQLCDRNAHEGIRKIIIKLREDAAIKPMKMKCISCSHEYHQTIELNVSDFFD